MPVPGLDPAIVAGFHLKAWMAGDKLGHDAEWMVLCGRNAA
jgi:hypothetical protein